VDARCAVDELSGEAAQIMKHWTDTFSVLTFSVLPVVAGGAADWNQNLWTPVAQWMS
jgi:hypothetical protein